MTPTTDITTTTTATVGASARAESGLSKAHICTHDEAVNIGRQDGAALTVWRGGSLVEVTRAPSGVTRERRGGGPRGKVTGFSAASRRRLLKLFGRLRDSSLPLFLTLTLPDGVAHDGEALKDKYLRRFLARLRRRFHGAALVWRMEVKARKSGEQIGEQVPHVHAVLWGVPMAPGLRKWVSLAWYEAVGSGDPKHLRAGTQVQAARSSRQVKGYASKLYAAKADDCELAEHGRAWGIFARDRLPWAEAVMRYLTAGELVRFLRILRGYFRAAVRRRKGKRPKARPGMGWCFVGDSGRWAELFSVGIV